MPYKLSKYNCIKIEERVAICNTLSGGMALLEREEYLKLKQIQEYHDENDIVREWVRLGFVVDTDKDETALVNYCRYRDTFLTNRPVYRILTTSACNARCFYCYEHGRRHHSMTKETAEETAKFIIEQAERSEKVSLNWFGGEPLLNHDVITLISQKVRNAIKDKDVSSSIITNASLFTKELIEQAKNHWNLCNIQVTLDGLKENHDKRKAYIEYANAFEKTIKTIGLLLSEGFHVSLRLNYDKENFDDIVKLIHYIHKIFGNPPNLSCYTYPLFNTTQIPKDSYISEKDISIYDSQVKDVLVECGYYNPIQIHYSCTRACFATDPYSYVINTDGLLYKCSIDMLDISRSVGNVKDGIRLDGRMIEWTTPTLPSKCNDCKLLPMCQGGCRVGRLLNIDMNDCSIKKQSLEYTLNYILNTYRL